MEISKDFIIEQLKKQISDYKTTNQEEVVGEVIEVGDGIAKISGLDDVMMSEMLEFENKTGEKVNGVTLNLEEGEVGAIVLGNCKNIKEGDKVKCLRKILSVPVGKDIIGRVLNPLGEPLDGKGKIKTDKYYPVEKIAPGVMARAGVNQPIQTGIKCIDSIIPIGRGQRELIIGDRQTGKTAIAIDTIINQQGEGVKCIYVAIGQKESKIATILEKLENSGAMEYTTVILAGASDPASLLYIAPYAGCAMAEYFLDQGEDVLIIYDDLSKHAVSYREIALLLRRPPGREAYPGDVFYLHSRLLERSCKLNEENKGGSITALPIIETQAGDVSAYIPTNVISITDGQIFLESDLFNQGQRPALNSGISVSRVGSSAQIKSMKQVAGKLKLEAAQYRELAAFAQFGSDLDEETKKKLERGKRLMEIFKQKQYSPLAVGKQVLIFFALTNGFLDGIEVDKIKDFEEKFYNYLNKNAKELLTELKECTDFNEKIQNKCKKIIEEFKKTI